MIRVEVWWDWRAENVMHSMTLAEVYAMYHTLAKACNKEFDTEFEYSDSAIERFGNDGHKEFGFTLLKSRYSDVWRIESNESDVGLNYHRYWVDYVPKERIISFVKFLEQELWKK